MVIGSDLVSAPISRDEALECAKKFISNKFGDPLFQWERNQLREIAVELSDQAISESIQLGENKQQLLEKLDFCIRLVEDIQFHGRSQFIRNAIEKDKEHRSTHEQFAVEAYNTSVWQRHNPQNSFLEGWQSESYFDGNRIYIAQLVAQYISRPWARHGLIDWALLDMLITSETCIYCEQIKMSGKIGETQLYGDYITTNGNLSKMKGGISSKIYMWLLIIILGWVIPIGIIILLFQFGWEKTGWIVLCLFLLSIAWSFLEFSISRLIKIYRYASGKKNPTNKQNDLLISMFDLWRDLQGPVINPSLVKNSMLRSRELGAVWDGAAWAIIDRAISIDPSVMIAKTRTN